MRPSRPRYPLAHSRCAMTVAPKARDSFKAPTRVTLDSRQSILDDL